MTSNGKTASRAGRQVSARLDDELHRRLTERAEADDRNVGSLVARAVRFYLDRTVADDQPRLADDAKAAKALLGVQGPPADAD